MKFRNRSQNNLNTIVCKDFGMEPTHTRGLIIPVLRSGNICCKKNNDHFPGSLVCDSIVFKLVLLRGW